MKKITFFLLLVTINFTTVLAQKKKAYRNLTPAIGLDASYIFDISDFYRYHEVDFTIRVTLPIWKNLQGGGRATFISGYGRGIPSRQFYMAGGFLEYRFVNAGPFDVFAHAGLTTGNICECEFNVYPYNIHSLMYLSFGPRSSLQLGEHLFANLSFLFQPILNKSTFPGWVNRPFMGVEYRF